MSHTTTRGRFATATAVRYEYEVTLSIELQVFVYYFDWFARKIISLQERRNTFQRKRRNKTQFLPISRIKYSPSLGIIKQSLDHQSPTCICIYRPTLNFQRCIKTEATVCRCVLLNALVDPSLSLLWVYFRDYFLNFLPRKIMFDVDIDLYVVDLQLNRLQAIADIFR